MASRYNLVLSDELDREVERVAVESEQTKSDIVRKALRLYIFARDGEKRGLKVGLAQPDQHLQTEIYGI